MSKKYQLNIDQVKLYEKQGYLLCNDIFSPEEIKNIIEWTHEIESFPETKEKWMKYYDPSLKDPSKKILTRVENFFDYHQKFKGFFNSEIILKNISTLFKSDVVLFKDKINLKFPGAKGFKPHQDATIWKDMYGIKSFITMVIAIDFANLENGCLEISEGKHKNGMLSETWKEISEDTENKLTWKPIITSPGAVIFFNDYTPHRSADNFSNKSRRTIFLTYNKVAEGDHRKQHFVDKRKNYPPNFERETGKSYTFHI